MSAQRPLRPLEPLSPSRLNSRAQHAMPTRDDDETQNTDLSGLTSLENGTDDFGKIIIQQARDEKRRQNALASNARLQPFRKARKDTSFALTYTNLAKAEKEASQSPTIVPHEVWSPQQSESGSDTANIRPRPPRTWGRNARVKRGWMKSIIPSEVPQKESGEQSEDTDTVLPIGAEYTHRSLGSESSTDWSAVADLPLESVEATSHSSPATPSEFRRGTTYERLVHKQRATERRPNGGDDASKRVSFEEISPPAESPGGQRLEAATERLRASLERRSRSRSISQDDIAADFTATSLVTSTPAVVSRSTRIEEIRILETEDVSRSGIGSKARKETSSISHVGQNDATRCQDPVSVNYMHVESGDMNAVVKQRATSTKATERPHSPAKRRGSPNREQRTETKHNDPTPTHTHTVESESDSHSNLRALSRLLSSKGSTPWPDTTSQNPPILPSPPMSPLRQIRPQNLPKSALTAVLKQSKVRPESDSAIGDSTIDSLEDILSPNDETITSNDDTLAGIRLPTSEPRNEGERQRQREVRQLVTMSSRLKATRANLRDAGKGLKRVEHQIDHSDASDGSINSAHSRGTCDRCHGKSDVPLLNPFRLLLDWTLSPFFRNKWRLTALGVVTTAFLIWGFLENILCLVYCQPEWAETMVGFGVDPYAPERPFVLVSVVARALGIYDPYPPDVRYH